MKPQQAIHSAQRSLQLKNRKRKNLQKKGNQQKPIPKIKAVPTMVTNCMLEKEVAVITTLATAKNMWTEVTALDVIRFLFINQYI